MRCTLALPQCVRAVRLLPYMYDVLSHVHHTVLCILHCTTLCNIQSTLKDEESKLRDADAAAASTLAHLETAAMTSKQEADATDAIAAACSAEEERVTLEVQAVEVELAAARPHSAEAESAAEGIRASDLQELRKLSKPTDIIRLVVDCVGLLRKERLNVVAQGEVVLGTGGRDKRTSPFLQDSYRALQAGMLSDARFLQVHLVLRTQSCLVMRSVYM
jgi:dynein heavy chain, axonemal